jgi:hypothetical protein
MTERKALSGLLVIAALGSLLWPCRALALNGEAGTSGAQFLKIGAGARASGMAESFAAVADDAYAAYYNPAGLASLKGSQFAGAHTSYFSDITYDMLSFAYPFGADGGRKALSLSIYHLGVGDIERRTSDTTDPSGKFGAADDSYAVSYAVALNKRFFLGATAKYISETIDTYRAAGFAADLGALYRLNPESERPMTAAFTVRNIGQRIGFAAGQSDPLPLGVVAALGVKPLNNLDCDFEVGKYRDTDLYGSLGLEYRHAFSPDFSGALRTGYTSIRKDSGGLNGLAMGAGLNFGKIGFDFAWVPFGDLGNTFRYALLVKF